MKKEKIFATGGILALGITGAFAFKVETKRTQIPNLYINGVLVAIDQTGKIYNNSAAGYVPVYFRLNTTNYRFKDGNGVDLFYDAN
ncbi:MULTISPECIES: hypothetical protein [Niastella]|uniref:Uncharacterized protein n=1 Tax=Niastella soli TaxID=2821487 RepID=A0ABS3YY65_9BACT|nr:hypothetical protein [Niastella soli]MBO9202818.1 hypothetical protein [Niastella soli]